MAPMFRIAMAASFLSMVFNAYGQPRSHNGQLNCISKNESVCASVARVLAKRGYTALSGSNRTDVVMPKLTIRFEEHAKTRFSLSGELNWFDDSGHSGRSPDMSFSVADAKLSAEMLDRFVELLLTKSMFFEHVKNIDKRN